jgi:hypothetical protein
MGLPAVMRRASRVSSPGTTKKPRSAPFAATAAVNSLTSVAPTRHACQYRI